MEQSNNNRNVELNSVKTFAGFIFKKNKKEVILITIGTPALFFLFKLLYPFPDFFSDSYSYIFAAYAHLDVNIWPIGYSKFLSLFHVITHSDKALVWFQYCFYVLSAAYFYFSLNYLYPLRKISRRILFIFLFFNPLFLYLSNYVSSDTLFTGLSLCWLTQLLWIIHQPRWYQILAQAILLFLAFTVRYNAMYYPLIAAVALLFSRKRLWFKLAGILIGPILIIPFILHSKIVAKELTGTAQFPILSGWQWGNNALYMREFLDEDSTTFPTRETSELDKIARN